MNTYGIIKYLKNIYSILHKFKPVQIKKIGENSYIPIPNRLSGHKYITVGKNVAIGENPLFAAIDSYYGQKFDPSLIIGDNVYIGPNAYISTANRIEIQSGCVLSESVYISDVLHGIAPNDGLIMQQNLITKGTVIIGENTFIGLRAMVMPGVCLGRNCVIAASSVVTKSFPDYSMVGGNPARLLKTYSFNEGKWISV